MRPTNLPIPKHITYRRTEGKFTLGSSDEDALYQFVFPDLTPQQIRDLKIETHFFVDLDRDYNYDVADTSPLDLAYEIKALYNSYWMHTGKNKLDTLIEYLESVEEEQEKLRKQYCYDVAIAHYEFWGKEAERRKKEIEQPAVER